MFVETQTQVAQTPIDRIRLRLEATGRECIERNNGWINTSCPVGHNHKGGDARPSFGFREIVNDTDDTDRVVIFNCFGNCTHKEILEALKLKEADLYSNPDGKGLASFIRHTKEAKQALTLRDYSRDKLLPLDFLMIDLGLYDGIFTFHRPDGTPYKLKGVTMPYHYPDGSPFERTKLRIALKKTGKSSHFYWSEGDEPPIAHGWQTIEEMKKAGYAVIVEGESDWQTLSYHRFPALGIPGTSHVKNTLEASMLQGIPVLYVIQEKTDQAGQNFPFEVQTHLQDAGYTGKILRIPLKTLTGAKDPSDLHKKLWDKEKPRDHQRFREEFQKALDQAKPMNYDTANTHAQLVDTTGVDQAIEAKDAKALIQAAPILARLTHTEYALYDQQIREVFGKGISMRALDAAVKEQRSILSSIDSVEKPSLDIIADDFAENHKDDWGFNALSSAWYQWTGTHWQNMQDSEAQKKSCVTLDRIVRDLMRKRGRGIDRSSDLDCVVRLAAIHCKRDFVPASGVVNFRNGTLEVSTGTLRQHDRNDQLTYCLPYDYDAHGQWSVICSFLQDLFPDKYARQNFMVHIGLSLMADTRMHYAGAIIGPPRVGKSTALDLANMTCGISEKEYAGKTLFDTDLEGKRTRYVQNKKRIVCIDELPADTLRNEENVKNMVAHSGVEMRGMMRDDEASNKWKPKMFMAMNEKPEYKDTSGAIKERIVPLMVSATRPKGERDLYLIDKMKPELGGFAASCIRLAKAALKRGYYPLSETMKLIINEMETSNNTLKQFIEEQCILDPGPEGFIFLEELYQKYKDFCEPPNKPVGKRKMGNELCEMGKGITQKKKRNPFAEKVNAVQRGLAGIRLRKETDPPMEEVSKETDDPMLNVDDVDDTLTILFSDRQHDKLASEAPLDTNVDDVDDNFTINTYRENTITQKKGDENNISPYICNRKEISSTSSTNHINQPIEQSEHVDDTENAALTHRQHRQHIVNIPADQPQTRTISVDDFLAFGKARGYPEVPEFDLKSGMIAWNHFANSRRIRMADVVTRLGGVA